MLTYKALSYAIFSIKRLKNFKETETVSSTLNVLFLSVFLNGGSELLLSEEASSKTKQMSVEFFASSL